MTTISGAASATAEGLLSLLEDWCALRQTRGTAELLSLGRQLASGIEIERDRERDDTNEHSKR